MGESIGGYSGQGQHGFSTGSGNDGKQPARTGQSTHENGPPNSIVGRPVPREANPRNRRSASKYTYLSSCLAITIRWIWLVPS